MIGSLRGVVLDRSAAGEVVLEVGGVGYRVTVPASTLAAAELAAPLFLHVHTHVRDDAIVLYGFAGRDERACFEALIGAHGVGPALALAILSALSPASLRRAIATDDVDSLTLVPGVGKKTAVRLLVELKSRLELPDTDLDGVVALSEDGPGRAQAVARNEVRAALTGLGYGAEEVRDALRAVPEEGSAEDLLRLALRQLAAVR